MKFPDLLAAQAPGTSFWVDAEKLGLTAEQFHELALEWESDGGGDGFALVNEPHRESSTRHSHIDMVMLRRDDE